MQYNCRSFKFFDIFGSFLSVWLLLVLLFYIWFYLFAARFESATREICEGQRCCKRGWLSWSHDGNIDDDGHPRVGSTSQVGTQSGRYQVLVVVKSCSCTCRICRIARIRERSSAVAQVLGLQDGHLLNSMEWLAQTVRDVFNVLGMSVPESEILAAHAVQILLLKKKSIEFKHFCWQADSSSFCLSAVQQPMALPFFTEGLLVGRASCEVLVIYMSKCIRHDVWICLCLIQTYSI